MGVEREGRDAEVDENQTRPAGAGDDSNRGTC